MSKSATSIEGATKLCHIVKRANFDGYGFNLHSEKLKPGQYIGKVDENSPAEAAGLKEGDRIIEVNGVVIGNATHKQVVQRIKAISNEVRLLLVDVHRDGLSGASETVTGTNGNLAKNDAEKKLHGTNSVMPGESANISTISMVATKRPSHTSTCSSSRPNGRDEMGNADVNRQNGMCTSAVPMSGNTNIEKGESSSVAMSTFTVETRLASTGPSGIPVSPPVVPLSNSTISPSSTTANNNHIPSSTPTDSTATTATTTTTGPKHAGSLQLPTTAAEMRAKLLSKKKYDPKSEGVDLKKKFEIIQKL